MRKLVDQAAVTLTARLVPVAGLPAPSGQHSDQLLKAIAQLSNRIPEMVVMGNLLRAALPAAPRIHETDTHSF
jgi:hypothetical protein